MLHVPHRDAYPHPPPMFYPTESAALGLAMNAPDLPEITVTAQDVLRLARLVDDLFHIRDRRVAFLARELDRAAVVDSAEIPGGVVTMRSFVEFRSGESGRRHRAQLVYPAEASVSEDKLSVLTPIGTALLGLSEGQSMPYEAEDGSVRRLSVNRVLFQPEAEGMAWL